MIVYLTEDWDGPYNASEQGDEWTYPIIMSQDEWNEYTKAREAFYRWDDFFHSQVKDYKSRRDATFTDPDMHWPERSEKDKAFYQDELEALKKREATRQVIEELDSM